MNDVFSQILGYTLNYEGGKTYTNMSGDAGGPTKWGVSLFGFLLPKCKTDPELLGLVDKNGDGTVDADDVKNLSFEDAVFIYRRYFWEAYKFHGIADSSPRKAFLLFDITVNSGPANSCGMAQKALIRMGVMNQSGYDKKWGPNTRKMIIETDEYDFLSELNQVRRDFYTAIVKAKATQAKFLNGWMNRVDRTENDLQELP